MAEGFNNLGSVYQALGQCNEGKEYHLKRLIIIEKIFGKGHDDCRRNKLYQFGKWTAVQAVGQ